VILQGLLSFGGNGQPRQNRGFLSRLLRFLSANAASNILRLSKVATAVAIQTVVDHGSVGRIIFNDRFLYQISDAGKTCDAFSRLLNGLPSVPDLTVDANQILLNCH
jgi:hypothetical protein